MVEIAGNSIQWHDIGLVLDNVPHCVYESTVRVG
jgi:hypothetical protein